MELKKIAAIAGKPGLFQVIKPARNGVIVETIGEKRIKTIVSGAHRISVLKEVSIYTTTAEGAISLEEVLQRLHEKYQGDLGIDKKSDEETLRSFIAETVPEYDPERVHQNDIKKLIGWYNIIQTYTPETFTTLMQEDEQSKAVTEAEGKKEDESQSAE